jgi:hypothetical protein
MTRLGDLELTPPGAAMALGDHRDAGDRAAEWIAVRAGGHTKLTTEESEKLMAYLRPRAKNLLDAWQALAERARHAARTCLLAVHREKDAGTPLLHTAEDPVAERDRTGRFVAPPRCATSGLGASLDREKARAKNCAETAGWKKYVFLRPEGQVRQSQIITTYGAGALIDLVDQAVLVGGLDFWSYGSAKGVPIIQEPRLRDALAESFRIAGRPLSFEHAFREPPAGDGRQPQRAVGIQVLEMPRWFVCQNPRCRALVRIAGLDLKGGRYRHQCEQKKGTESVPVRFVGACRRGHLQEFPWIPAIGRWNGVPGAGELLEGAGRFCEVVIQCACGAGATRGRDARDEPPCKEASVGVEETKCELRLLVRTKNGYFPQVVSAHSLPEKGRELEIAVRMIWDVLQAATAETLAAFRAIPKVKAALEKYPDEQVLKAVQAVKQNLAVERKPIRTAEFEQLISASPEAPGDLPRAEDSYARTHKPKDLSDKLAQVVVVRKLRESGTDRLHPHRAGDA